MERPLRICDVCGGYDDHPRHQVVWSPGQAPAPDPEVYKKLIENIGPANLGEPSAIAAVSDFFDTTVQLRHMDCCRQVGCTDGTCDVVTAGATDLRGPDLQAHLETRKGETYFVDGRPASEVEAELVAAAQQDQEA